MRRLTLSILLTAFALCTFAQGNGYDMQLLSTPDIAGSSRYVGLAGAMAAVGGDVSAAKDNVAGLAFMRHSEVSLSLDLNLRQSSVSASGADPYNHLKVRLPQVNWTFSFLKDNRRTGVLANTITIGYQRLCNYDNEWYTGARTFSSSQTDIMADQSYGLSESELSSDNAYNNSDIGWLSKAGYDAYLTGLVDGATTEWGSLEPGNVNASLHLTESGYLNGYSFGWAMNVSNHWYFGLGVNILSLKYQKQSDYYETFESGNSYHLSSSLTASGLGVNFQAGVIYRPTQWVRLAAALHTPSFMTIKYTSYGDITSSITDSVTLNYSSTTPSGGYADQASCRMPFRSVLGAAFIVGTKGLVSLEYDYQAPPKQYRTEMYSEHMLKLGTEWVAGHHCFLDFGYALRLSGRYREADNGTRGVFLPGYTSARLDTDFRHENLRHYATFGVSFRNEFLVLGAAYQFQYATYDLYAHAYQAAPFSAVPESLSASAMTHRVTFTLSWKYTR